MRIKYYSYRWFIPFTHSIEKIGSVNSDTMSLTTENTWEKVIWFMPNETLSKILFYFIISKKYLQFILI